MGTNKAFRDFMTAKGFTTWAFIWSNMAAQVKRLGGHIVDYAEYEALKAEFLANA